MDRFAADAQLAHGSLSISVLDLTNGKTIAAYQPQLSLTPASTLKLISTAVALSILGEDYQFKTDLEHDGHIDAEGVLQGNLYIKGYGDPTLGSHHFQAADNRVTVLDKMVAAIQTAGISRIEGQIVGDASWSEGAAVVPAWPWEDIGNYYGAGAWGLNFQENLYFLHFQQKNRLGARPDILEIEPEIPNLLLINELSSAEKGSGDNAYIFGGPYAYTRFIRGTIPVGGGRFTIKGSIPDPPFFAAQQLLLALTKAGIPCTGSATSQLERDRTGGPKPVLPAGERKNFYHYYSPRLNDIAREALYKSVNIYCEAFLKALGKKVHDEGSIAAGLEVVKGFLEERGLDLEGFFMEDGSGLSPGNSLSSAQLTVFLQAMAKEGKNFTAFQRSLPVGGQSGTLKYLFKGTVAEGRIRAKSGGMKRVRSYAGYVQTVGGKRLAFAIIANNYTGKSSEIRKKMERLMIDFCKG